MNLFKFAVVCFAVVAACGCGEPTPTAKFRIRPLTEREKKIESLEKKFPKDADEYYQLASLYSEEESKSLTDQIKVAVNISLNIKAAAKRGHPEAQNQLGFYYDNGMSPIVKNHAKAGEYYRLAAEQGLKDAQNNLGCWYYEGLGVEKNPVEAYAWVSISGNSENTNAIAEELSDGQLSEAKKRAAELLEKYGSGK